MFKTELEWYTPQEKMPENSRETKNNIIWSTKAGNIKFGYLFVYLHNSLPEEWRHHDEDDEDGYDKTENILFWTYIDIANIKPV